MKNVFQDFLLPFITTISKAVTALTDFLTQEVELGSLGTFSVLSLISSGVIIVLLIAIIIKAFI